MRLNLLGFAVSIGASAAEIMKQILESLMMQFSEFLKR